MEHFDRTWLEKSMVGPIQWWLISVERVPNTAKSVNLRIKCVTTVACYDPEDGGDAVFDAGSLTMLTQDLEDRSLVGRMIQTLATGVVPLATRTRLKGCFFWSDLEWLSTAGGGGAIASSIVVGVVSLFQAVRHEMAAHAAYMKRHPDCEHGLGGVLSYSLKGFETDRKRGIKCIL